MSLNRNRTRWFEAWNRAVKEGKTSVIVMTEVIKASGDSRDRIVMIKSSINDRDHIIPIHLPFEKSVVAASSDRGNHL